MNKIKLGLSAIVLAIGTLGSSGCVGLQNRTYYEERYEEAILESIDYAKKSDIKGVNQEIGLAQSYGRHLGYSERQISRDLDQVFDQYKK